MEKYLNAKDLAQRYGLSVITVFKKAKSGEFPAGIKIGRARRWSVDELEEFEKNLKGA